VLAPDRSRHDRSGLISGRAHGTASAFAISKAVAMSNARRTPAARTARKKTVPAAPTVKFMGASYKVADKLGIWPQMQLARAAQDGINLGDARGLAAVYSTLQNVIHPDDWGRFENDMISKKTDDLLALLQLMQDAVQVVAAHQNGTPAANGTEPPEVNGKADAAVPGSLQVTG
jgi:hypothetical protein